MQFMGGGGGGGGGGGREDPGQHVFIQLFPVDKEVCLHKLCVTHMLSGIIRIWGQD